MAQGVMLCLAAAFLCPSDLLSVPVEEANPASADIRPLLEPSVLGASANIVLPKGQYYLEKDFVMGNADSPLESITLDGQGSEVFFKNGAGLTLGDVTGKKTIRLVMKNIIFKTDDKTSAAPILTVGRCFNSVLDSVRAIGARHRPSAVRLVRPWGSTVRNCHFGYSNIGLESSSAGYDATHMTYLGNTFDHCNLAGAILAHHVAGLISGCSFENNDSVGLALVAGSSSGDSASTNVTVQNCYFLNNARKPSFPDASPLMAGYPIAGTSYQSSIAVMHLSLLNNYITFRVPVSVRLNIFTGLVCTNNRLDGTTADILVEGMGAFSDNASWGTNRNQSGGGFILLDKTTVGLRSNPQIFLSGKGEDTADGLSVDRPVRSWKTALGRLKPNGTIVLAGDVSVTESIRLGSQSFTIRGNTGREIIRKKSETAFLLTNGAQLSLDRVQCIDESTPSPSAAFFQIDRGQLVLGSSVAFFPARKDAKPTSLVNCLTEGTLTLMPGGSIDILSGITLSPSALLEIRSAAGIEMKVGKK